MIAALGLWSAAPFALAAGTVLASDARDSEVSPGVLGFVVVALLGVATWLLIRSMTRRLKKIDLPPEDDGVPTSTEDRAAQPPDAPAGSADD